MHRIRDRYQGYETGGKKQVKNGYKDKEEGSTKKPIKMTEREPRNIVLMNLFSGKE